MSPKHLITLALIVSLAGCGGLRESRFNPFNWFGKSQEEKTLEPSEGYGVVADNRILVDNVISLRIDRTPEGAIITAVGLPPTQGFWNAELVPANLDELPEKGVLTYQFRISRPYVRRPSSTQQSREVSVAHFVSSIKLQNVSQIVVQGENTQRRVRR